MTGTEPRDHPCPTCGVQPDEDCRPTGTATGTDEWWREYRRQSPHPSRGIDWRTVDRDGESHRPNPGAHDRR